MAATATERNVVYCGICTLPPEYCEFGGSLKRCKEWLEDSHPAVFAKVYRTEGDAVAADMGDLSLARQEKIEREITRKQEKEGRKQEKEAAKKNASHVTIRRIERTKRKYVIALVGMEVFGSDLKKVAKQLANKFATGASVTKGVLGNDEITIQGDLSDEIHDFIVQQYPEISPDHIDQVEEKPKKKAAA